MFTSPRPYRPPSVYGTPPSLPRSHPGPYLPPQLFGNVTPRRLDFYVSPDEEWKNKVNKLDLHPNPQKQECSICYNQNDTGLLSCGHAFHKQCIKQWFILNKKTCPYCRTIIEL